MDAVREMEPDQVAEDIIRSRREFYRRIVDANPEQNVFLRGWYNRLDLLAKACNLDDEGEI